MVKLKKLYPIKERDLAIYRIQIFSINPEDRTNGKSAKIISIGKLGNPFSSKEELRTFIIEKINEEIEKKNESE